MINRVMQALVVTVAVTLGCILLGMILLTIDVSIAGALGGFVKTYSAAIGVLAGLWWFFGHSTSYRA